MYAYNQVYVVKVNLSVCLIKHSAVKVYVGEKAYIQAFFSCSLFYKADNLILGWFVVDEVERILKQSCLKGGSLLIFPWRDWRKLGDALE